MQTESFTRMTMKTVFLCISLKHAEQRLKYSSVCPCVISCAWLIWEVFLENGELLREEVKLWGLLDAFRVQQGEKGMLFLKKTAFDALA